MFRIGFGFDVHKLEDGHALWLGGINIPSDKGAIGHSDADVLIHAICDALLGAANLGDIGKHFPDTDPALKGIRSTLILKKTVQLIGEAAYVIGNIDTTISLQEPKIFPYIEQMKKELSGLMGIDVNSISIKATTTERLGFEGRREGVSAYAIALIQKRAS
ncbi:MAG: 2-C-methyl-D-erythritol 2,4-cyclodiphosphate synthase [Bacteroidota bacterium]|nr:2-C-methyl-D-erythritol 2,4-cyclodiphosphate synthase [Bacteroidota bacterium]